MVDCVVPAHARDAQSDRLQQRQADVDAVEDLRRLADLGDELGLDGAGALGAHEVYRAAEVRHQRQKQHQNAHAAHPLRE